MDSSSSNTDPSQTPSTTDIAASIVSTPISTSLTTTAAPQTSNNPNPHNVLNYYFLLLALFAVFLFLAYYLFARLHRRRNNLHHGTSHSALAQDLDQRWPGQHGLEGRGWRPGTGRRGWSNNGGGGIVMEGLDERGEAPPPYLKEVESAVLPVRNGSGGVLDRGAGRGGEIRGGVARHRREEGKPPEYGVGDANGGRSRRSGDAG